MIMENQGLERNYKKIFGDVFQVKFYPFLSRNGEVKEIAVLNFMNPVFYWPDSDIRYFIDSFGSLLDENFHYFRIYKIKIEDTPVMKVYLCAKHGGIVWDVSINCPDIWRENNRLRSEGKRVESRRLGNVINPYSSLQIIAHEGTLTLPCEA